MLTMDNLTPIAALTGALTGMCGLILSLINTWHQLQRDKVRLKVVPSQLIPVGGLASLHINFGIEVINLSEFPITLADAGFQLKDGRRGTLSTLDGMEPKGHLPARLEPHMTYQKQFWMDHSTLDLTAIKCAYARTECGTVAYGDSPALRGLRLSGVTNGR